jgi:hypothetical protein
MKDELTQDQIRELDSLLDAWTVPPAPADLAGRIIRKAHATPSRPAILRLVARLAPLAAAAVIIAAVVVYYYVGRPAEAPHSASDIAAVPEDFVLEGIDLFADAPANGDETRLSRTVVERIRNHTGGSLAEALNRNRRRWRKLSPAQQKLARQEALAFLQLDPQQQKKILDEYARKAQAVPAVTAEARLKQARWLRAVVESFTPAQVDQLRGMSPAQRAETFIRQRNQLIAEGKLQPVE